MKPRTDLAIDIDYSGEGGNGIEEKKEKIGDISISHIKITNNNGEKLISKPMGDYITIEFPDLNLITDYENLKNAISFSLKKLMPEKTENILLVGLGNTEITPDSIGPLTAGKILATRHISGQFAKQIGLKGLKSVSVICPNVLGKTGIEATEIIASAVDIVKPQIVIAVDALASNNVSRLFKTVQLCNTGITPGSGVKNSRKELNEKTLGVTVIAIGVPTVADASVLMDSDKKIMADLFVTPKEVDLLSNRISDILSSVLNVFLQPDLDEKLILQLV